MRRGCRLIRWALGAAVLLGTSAVAGAPVGGPLELLGAAASSDAAHALQGVMELAPTGELYFVTLTKSVAVYDVGSGRQLRVAPISAAEKLPMFPVDALFGPDGRLYVADYSGRILRSRDARLPLALEVWFTSETTRVVPVALAFGRDGKLVVLSGAAAPGLGQLYRIDPASGELLGPIGPRGLGGIAYPVGLAIDARGDLYVGEASKLAIQRIDGESGAVRGFLVDTDAPAELANLRFGTDGDLYVLDKKSAAILRFDGKSGARKGALPLEGHEMRKPVEFLFRGAGELLVSDLDLGKVLRLKISGVAEPAATLPEPARAPLRAIAVAHRERKEHVMFEEYGHLLRELVRQAVVLAAADGLGLAVHDAEGDRPLPDGVEPCDVDVRAVRGAPVVMALACGTGEGRRVVFTGEVGRRAAFDEHDFDYGGLVQALVATAESDLLPALRAAGFVSASGGSPGPAPTESDLAEMSLARQYAAVVALHRPGRAPESMEACSALVRAYANLGLLSGFLWTSENEQFAARSLLLAERCVARHGGEPLALAARGYARTLVGLPGSGLADFQDAKRLVRGGELPGWIRAAEAYARFDLESLDRIASAGGSESQLAAVLALLGAREAEGAFLALTAAERAIAAAPGCSRCFEESAEAGGVGSIRSSSTKALEELVVDIGDALGRNPAAPEAVRKAADRCSAATGLGCLPAVRDALLASDGAGTVAAGLGWSGLARLLDESAVVLAWRRADFLAEMLAVSAAEFVAEIRPVIGLHPHWPLVEAYSYEREREKERLAAALSGVVIARPQPPARHVLEVGSPLAGGRGARSPLGPISSDVRTGLDLTAPDLRDGKSVGDSREAAQRLWRVSPHSPAAIAGLIANDWSFAESRVEEWQRQHGRRPNVVKALAGHYLRAGDEARAERLLQVYTEIAPDLWGYTKLAQLRRVRGGVDAYVQTLAAFLEQPDLEGLEHERAQVEIAQTLVAEKRAAEARPFAAAAAESGAAWAMLALSNVLETLGDLDEAERQVRATSERYESSALAWYLWCRRTGQGDLPRARDVALDRVEALGLRRTPEEAAEIGVFWLLEGDLEQAFNAFGGAYERGRKPYDGVQAALLAWRLGKEETASTLLGRVAKGEAAADTRPESRPALTSLAAALGAQFEGGASLDEVARQVAFLRERSSSPESCNLDYLLGFAQELRGARAAATESYRRALETEARWKWSFTLASEALRRLGQR